ncbi:Cysteine-rich secretory protein LCCL domain-containing 1 [Paramecium bursaria]
MNVIHWDSGLAKRGQQCAEKCPAHVGTCAFHQDYGVLTQHIPKGSAKGAQDVIDIWIKDNHKAKQILFAREQKFGCGKAENDKMLYVVCYFDKKYTNKIQTFLPGPVGASCQLGMSKMYSGLCAVAGQTNSNPLE